MAFGYIDTSYIAAIALGERGSNALRRRAAQFDSLLSSNLLEAELRATFQREGVQGEPAVLAVISWIIPDRPLSQEIARVLETGYLRGADCWHLATALYLTDDPTSLTFLTLDERQRAVAKSLGFPV